MDFKVYGKNAPFISFKKIPVCLVMWYFSWVAHLHL